MSDTAPGNRGRDHQKIPRIEANEAARIYTQCDHLEESPGNPVATLHGAGFGRFLAVVEKQILQLAVQPDSWGERTRARLISTILASLSGVPAASWSVVELADISNVLMPCFLLELGRRAQHLQVEFPLNPSEPDARFALRAGPSHPVHSITKQELIRLVTQAGEELVGLCYFGDQQSRAAIEAQLGFEDKTKVPPTRE